MSILKSFRGAVTEVLDTVSSTAKTVQETVNMGNQYVHHRATAFKVSDKETVLLSLSKTMAELQAELDSDPKLAEMHDKLAKDLGW